MNIEIKLLLFNIIKNDHGGLMNERIKLKHPSLLIDTRKNSIYLLYRSPLINNVILEQKDAQSRNHNLDSLTSLPSDAYSDMMARNNEDF
ncbi:hypothetical protein HZS_5524 [Henneguya salminicola]|nr:hypothetical protein HZS_5524 [Henneguya salminicola]